MGDPQLVVGTADCPIFTIQQVLKKDAIIRESWSDLARGLGISSERIEKFRNDMILNKITYPDVIFQALDVWVAQKGSHATLDALIQAVEGHCGADGVAEIIRRQFKQEGAMSSPSSSLFNNKLPERPSYYINRILRTRNIISHGIFEDDSPDIFLFKGMDRSDLAKLVKSKITGDSMEQLSFAVIDANFIILRQGSHFERICGKTSDPVHLLKKESDGRLRWIRSKGDMTHLQGFVDHSQDEVDEESFCERLDSNKSPVCISDSPGMGKSILLAEIGRRLKVLYPNRIICFIALTEFIKLVRQIGMDDKVKSVAKALENLSGHALSSPEESTSSEITTSFELLLDGLDEVEVVDQYLAYTLLKTIQNSFKSIRLWITARPHLLEELEDHLNQLGYNIRPFQMDDQIKFLSSYWSSKGQLNQNRIHRFAKHCLESLKSKLNSTDQDIAGIPLQCLLIGECYEVDAVEYARIDEDVCSMEVEIEIETIANLYHNLIKKKIEKLVSTESGVDHRQIMTMHARLSLELIFPNHLKHLNPPEPVGNDQIPKLLRIGILEAAGPGSSLRFLHRTFAEYFVAWLVIDNLKRIGEIGDVFEFPEIFVHVLNTTEYVEPGIKSFKFKYPVITYFLDTFLSDLDPNVFHRSSTDSHSLLLYSRILDSSVNGNLAKLFKFLIGIRHPDSGAKMVVDNFIRLAIMNSSLEIVRYSLLLELHRPFGSHTQIEALRTSVKRGKFSILEFLLKEKKLTRIVKELMEDASELVHDCIENSKNCSQAEIDQRLCILRILVEINPLLLEIKGGLWKEPPLLCYGVHVRLLKELVSLGADVTVQGIGGSTVLHMNDNRSHLTSSDYHDLVLCIPAENLQKLVVVKGDDKNTPLMTILRWIDPRPETLVALRDAGASFNNVDANKDSILEMAIKNGRSTETTRRIIAYGGKINRKPFQRLANMLGLQKEWKGTKTLLHYAAENGNLEALELLLEDKRMDVNITDEDGMTPLDTAIISCRNDGNRLDVALTLQERGGTFTEYGNSELQQSLLHMAVEKDNLQSVQLLIYLTTDINIKDINGNTALHLAAKCKNEQSKVNNFYIAQSLINGGADPNISNCDGMTPLDIALLGERLIFKKFLLDLAQISTNLAILFAARVEPDADEQSILMSQLFIDELLDVNFQDSSGNSLLHIAALKGLGNAVSFLLTWGAEVNLKNNNGATALQFTTTRLEVIKPLIVSGADIYARDKFYDSFIHNYIRSFQNPSAFHRMVEYLKSNNLIQIFIKRGEGQDEAALLHLAVRYLELEDRTLSLLHSCHADFNAVDSVGDSVLFYAVMGTRSVKFVDTLINQFGANPRHRNKQNWSLLHYTARHGTADALKYFMGLNILEINGLTAEGYTPLHTAPYFRSRRMEVVKKCKLLIYLGADVNIRNKKGHTAADVASSCCDKEDKVELTKLLQITS